MPESPRDGGRIDQRRKNIARAESKGPTRSSTGYKADSVEHVLKSTTAGWRHSPRPSLKNPPRFFVLYPESNSAGLSMCL